MKYAIINIMLGVALGALALAYPAWAVPVFWLGASFIVLGCAYAVRCPAILGKREDGSMAWWSWICLLPLHFYLHAIWMIVRIVSKEPAFNVVTPELTIGRRLLSSEMPKTMKVVVDLTAEFAEPMGVRLGRNYRVFPVLDATAPDLEAMLAFIDSLPDTLTYVHCAQGHGRTGLFSIVYLLRKGLAGSVTKAETMVMAARPGVGLSVEQRRLLGFAQMRLAGEMNDG